MKNSHFILSLINGTLLPVPISLNTSKTSNELCAPLKSKSSERIFPFSEGLLKSTQEPETLDFNLKEVSEPLVD